jgi:HD-like signal output (HDOD) protein
MLQWIQQLWASLFRARPASAMPRLVRIETSTRAPLDPAAIASIGKALPTDARDDARIADLRNKISASNANVERTIMHFDLPAHLRTSMQNREELLLARIAEHIEHGRFELPQLPHTSMAVIDLTSKSSAEVKEITELIASDPVLSSELLRTSNSVLYAGAEPCDTVSSAVMRIGLRNLRSLMFSLSMRGAILRDKSLNDYADEVWRQSFAMANIARAIAKPLHQDPEKAFLLGLLADIGKVSLLAMLRREVTKSSELSPPLVGRVFYTFHERAGAALARAWRLPEDIASVAGCHHRFEQNTLNPAAAALVSLAHRLDLFFTQSMELDVRAALECPEFEYFKLSDEKRWALIQLAQAAYQTSLESVASVKA